MQVFYSWQMDATRKVNKDFIYGALEEAIKQLDQDVDFAEAERDNIKLDQDTKGVLGSPEISRVIFDKIAVSHVFVADVSLVARGRDDRPHINSNVGIELGYAYGKIGYQSVIQIMNTHFGGPENLPFDLRIRRHPVRYCLSPDASASEIAQEKSRLSKELAKILKIYRDSVPSDTSKEHSEIPFIGQRGRFWNLDEPLVPENRERKTTDIFGQSHRMLYFRCVPERGFLEEMSVRDAVQHCQSLQPLFNRNGYSTTRNQWGAMVYAQNSNPSKLMAATQLFRNREIWAVDLYCAAVSHEPEGSESGPILIVPTGAVNGSYPQAIDNILKLARELGYGDRLTIEMGLSGAVGVHLTLSRRLFFDRFPGPFHAAEVFFRDSVSSSMTGRDIMNRFWDKLCSELGMDVPNELKLAAQN